MPRDRILKRVHHTPKDMLELVSGVEGYPKFINLISAVRSGPPKKLADGREQFEADATVRYKFIRETFRSQVTIDRDEQTINVTKADRTGPLKTLENRWVFHELSDGSTLVDFFVDVSMKAFPLNMLLSDKFDKAAAHMINLFEKRASKVYDSVGQADLDIAAEKERLGLS